MAAEATQSEEVKQNENALPVCYFDIAIGGKAIGRIEMTLRADLAPKTVANFRGLCTGKHPLYEDYSYKGTYFHRFVFVFSFNHNRNNNYNDIVLHIYVYYRVIPDFMVQGGRLYEKSGDKGLKRRPFIEWEMEHDKSPLPHSGPGILSMANKQDTEGKRMQNSGFFICTAQDPLNYLDDQHIAFGKVTKGMDIVIAIEQIVRDKKNAYDPSRDKQKENAVEIMITDCGELKK